MAIYGKTPRSDSLASLTNILDKMALLYRKTGRPEESKRVSARVLALRRDKGSAPGTLGELEAAVTRRPDDPGIRFRLGQMYDKAGRYAEARDQFLACVELQPDNRQAYEYLALLYEGEQKYEAAITAYQKAIELEQRQSSQSEWPYLNYGILLSKINRHEEALNFLQQAVRKSPNSPKAHFEVGRVSLRLGRVKAAKTSLLRAVNLDPDMPRAHYFLGNLYQKLNEEEKAQQEWARFRELQRAQADSKLRSSRPMVSNR